MRTFGPIYLSSCTRQLQSEEEMEVVIAQLNGRANRPSSCIASKLVGFDAKPLSADSLQVLLGLFLQAKGSPFPQHSRLKSASALSRFLNRYQWPTWQVIRLMRHWVANHLLPQRSKRRRPHLQVIVDLACLS